MNEPERPPFPDFDASKAVFVFDGVCILCSGGARFLMRHDRHDRIRFTPAQSPLGKLLYAHFGLDYDETYLLVDRGRAYAKSSGYFRMCAILGGWWQVLRIGAIVPKGLRDAVYDVVARNRYRWFGKTGYCALLTEEQRKKLLQIPRPDQRPDLP